MKVVIKLQDILNKRKMSQREISRLTGITYTTINQMCLNTTHIVPLKNLATICNHLGVSITDVLELVPKNFQLINQDTLVHNHGSFNKVIFKLQDTLNKYKISQREASRLTGIRFTTINQMCLNTTKRIPLKNLAAICNHLDVQITDVLELVPDNYQSENKNSLLQVDNKN